MAEPEPVVQPSGEPDDPVGRELSSPAQVSVVHRNVVVADDDEPERDAVTRSEWVRLIAGSVLMILVIVLAGILFRYGWQWTGEWEGMMKAANTNWRRDVLFGVLAAKALITSAGIAALVKLAGVAERLLIPFAYADEAQKLTGRAREPGAMSVLFGAIVARLKGEQKGDS